MYKKATNDHFVTKYC